MSHWLSNNGGEALWALMVFVGFGLLFPRVSTLAIALLALTFPWSVGFFQRCHAQWIETIRATIPGKLVLGNTFAWPDLAAYTVGRGAWGAGGVAVAKLTVTPLPIPLCLVCPPGKSCHGLDVKTGCFAMWLGLALAADAKVIEVGGDAALREALARLEPGMTLKITPGQYRGGLAVRGVERLVVEAADPERPPEFVGGTTAWQFSRCHGLVVRNLVCRSQTGNGLNIDDGGDMAQPVRDVRIEKVTVLETGPRGNFDGIKCSGIAGLVIEDCRIEGWGGQAIDFVGCRDAVIRRCRITGRDGFSQTTGPQFKGGSGDVVIEDCVLVNAGQRPIHAGGSTGIEYFRPPGAKYEARSITIRRNVIVGGDCAAAFTGVDGAVFEGNVIVHPTHWVFRILQETRLDGFPPCRNVVVRGNVVVFQRAGLRGDVNIGDGTAPETFRFERNWWFAADTPQRSRPTLPGKVAGEIHGQDPKLDPDTRLPLNPDALRLLGR